MNILICSWEGLHEFIETFPFPKDSTLVLKSSNDKLSLICGETKSATSWTGTIDNKDDDDDDDDEDEDEEDDDGDGRDDKLDKDEIRVPVLM